MGLQLLIDKLIRYAAEYVVPGMESDYCITSLATQTVHYVIFFALSEKCMFDIPGPWPVILYMSSST